MADHNELGEKGEEMALQHLEKNGFEILDTNWRFGKDEIDIIARKSDELIIVEVKTRINEYFGDPEEFVSTGKQKRLIKAANAYIEEKDLDLETRFDVIGIILNSKYQKINHIEEAFGPQW